MRFAASAILCLAVLLIGRAASFAEPPARQFEYDASKPFDAICEQLEPRNDAVVHGCRFAGPSGGLLRFILVNPKIVNPPFAGVIFQHGGGQSITNYLSEALILAQAGVVSILADAPARSDGKKSEINAMKLQEAADFQAEIVISERRLLDFLLQQPGVDPKRIAYVGHSYGGIAGGAASRRVAIPPMPNLSSGSNQTRLAPSAVTNLNATGHSCSFHVLVHLGRFVVTSKLFPLPGSRHNSVL